MSDQTLPPEGDLPPRAREAGPPGAPPPDGPAWGASTDEAAQPDGPSWGASTTGTVSSPPGEFLHETPPRRGFHMWIIVAILAVAGGGLFAWRNIAGSGAGASTPEAAIRALFTAAEREDMLGVLSSLLPSERESFRQPLTDIRDELVRLEVLSNQANLNGFPGIDLRFENLAFKTTTLADGFAVVEATSGTGHVTTDPARLPFGSFLKGLAGGALPQEPTSSSGPLAGEDVKIVAVREDGRWYASLWYTTAESAREETGAPLPSFGKGVAPQGATSPEGAVRALVDAISRIDFRAMIALTPPDEARALHDYASIFIQQADAASAEARKGVRIRVRDLKLSSERQGAIATVKITSAEFDVTATDGSFAIAFDGKCFSGKGLPFPAPRICTDELQRQSPFPAKNADVGFVTVQSGGQWFISPTRTVLGGFTQTLRALTPEDLRQLRDMFAGMFGAGMFEGPRTG